MITLANELQLVGKKNEEKVVVTDLISVQALDRSFFGIEFEGKKTQLELAPEEALYLIDVRNAKCFAKKKELSFNAVAAKFEERSSKFLARYFCFKDWRDRGLIARPISEASGNYGRSPLQRYPSKPSEFVEVKAKGLFFHDDLMSIIDDDEGQTLYEKHWFGPWGTYKAKKHGRFLKLDAYETLFLMKHACFVLNVKERKLVKDATTRR
ncbi:MAG: hypothetical protein V1817_04450, partial [Candidatus Micrarchaeota archaeon]